jgi:hypothetical protein
VLALGLFALGTAGPAGAGKIFTIDGNSNDIAEPGGDDDVTFSFVGSMGTVSGSVRAIDTDGLYTQLSSVMATYIDFTGGSYPDVDITKMDVLIVDITLDVGSALIDEIGFGVSGGSANGIDPVGAGYLDPCDPLIPVGCAYNVPGGGEITVGLVNDGILLAEGGGIVPGAALFGFDKLGLSDGNLEGGEITRRLLIAYLDLDNDPQAPLSKIGQGAKFMFSSGTNFDPIFVDIVPEPATGLLVGLGLTMLTWVGRSRAR